MHSNKLFLICPDCYLEDRLRKHFKGNLYFLTALGAIFDISEADYTESISNFLARERIQAIYIVNDCSCTFIQNVVHQNKKITTRVEVVMQELLDENDLDALEETEKLVLLNIKRQAQAFRESAFISYKLENQEVELKGILYNRAQDKCIEVLLEYPKAVQN